MKELTLTNKHQDRGHRCKAQSPTFAEIRVHYINAGYTAEQIERISFQDLAYNMTDDEINAAKFSDEQLAAWSAGTLDAQKRGA